MIRLLVLASVLALGVACKKKATKADLDRRRGEELIAEAEAFATEMCACPDLACADKVIARFSSSKEHEIDDPAQRARYSGATSRMVGCRQHASTAPVAPVAPVEAPKPIPPPDPVAALPGRPANAAVDQLIADVREWLPAHVGPTLIRHVRAEYVHPDGTLDPKYGVLSLWSGVPVTRPEVKDDPDRPTGAPIPAPAASVEKLPDRCPKLRFSGGTWTIEQTRCEMSKGVGSRCAMSEIWKRAIANGAPSKGVAIIEQTDSDLTRGTWYFSIEDKLRDVHAKAYVDDNGCPAR